MVGPRRVDQGDGPVGGSWTCPGLRRGPPQKVSLPAGRWRCTTRVQESIGTASCRTGHFVAEIGAVGVVCHIRASSPIPGLLPCSWGSPSFEMGKVEHGGLRRSWGSASFEMGKVEHGLRGAADWAEDTGNPGWRERRTVGGLDGTGADCMDPDTGLAQGT